MNAPDNVIFHDIHEVPRYTELQNIFSNPDEDNLWKRVDLARLLVLEHCFQTQPDKQDIFYADFDVVDVKLDHRAVRSCLDGAGICVPITGSLIENSYIALKRGKCDQYLASSFIPRTIASVKGSAINGYGAFCDSLDEVVTDLNIFASDIIAETYLVEPSKYVTEADPFYQECGLN